MPARQPESPQEGGEGGVIAILVLGVGYRKQCEEKAVQCLSRLNIGLGAGTGRLQQRWGGKLSSAVALAATAPHPLPGQDCSSRPCPGSLAASLGIPSGTHPCLGGFLAGLHFISQYRPSRRSTQPSPCIGRDAARPEVSPNSHQGRGRSLVLSLTRTTSAAQHLSKALLALGQAP